MLLTIDDEICIEEINDHFNLCFPFLQLEFFSGPHHIHAASTESRRLHPKLKIGEISKRHVHAVFDFKSHIQVAELENRFKRELGLHVQVCWFDGKDWLQTTDRDDMSLKDLNAFAEKLSSRKN